MKTKTKVLIMLTVAILSILALVIPRYTSQSKFHVTNKPLVAFQEAQKSGKPIFLEFYAKW
jgi:cytochrome c-type biogenesis protein